LLGNKAILPVLWEMFPDHPNLLPAYFENPNSKSENQNLNKTWVSKPKFGREGEGILFSDDFEKFEDFVEKT
jgi:glutathionylspermidine synthase